MGQRTTLPEENGQSSGGQIAESEDTMPHQTEDEIIDDILKYLRKHESVCIQTERQSGLGWIRKHNRGWQHVKQTSQGELSSTIMKEEMVRAILKANYYQLIPTTQAGTESEKRIWTAVEDSE
ncbi:hypothetical protein [Haloarcula sp. H-GB5]|jgi:hypothetical protein